LSFHKLEAFEIQQYYEPCSKLNDGYAFDAGIFNLNAVQI